MPPLLSNPSQPFLLWVRSNESRYVCVQTHEAMALLSKANRQGNIDTRRVLYRLLCTGVVSLLKCLFRRLGKKLKVNNEAIKFIVPSSKHTLILGTLMPEYTVQVRHGGVCLAFSNCHSF